MHKFQWSFGIYRCLATGFPNVPLQYIKLIFFPRNWDYFDNLDFAVFFVSFFWTAVYMNSVLMSRFVERWANWTGGEMSVVDEFRDGRFWEGNIDRRWTSMSCL